MKIQDIRKNQDAPQRRACAAGCRRRVAMIKDIRAHIVPHISGCEGAKTSIRRKFMIFRATVSHRREFQVSLTIKIA